MKLQGTQTHANLKAAYAAESAASVMYRWSAQQADVEGFPEVAKRFTAISEAKVGQAMGHLQYLELLGDPATGLVIGDALDNLEAARVGESNKASEMFPGFAETAREEGLTEIAEWFESAIRTDEGHADKFAASRDEL